MIKPTTTRLIQTIPTVIDVHFLIFVLGFFRPDDPLEYQFNEETIPEPHTDAHLREGCGLNQPFLVQFRNYVVDLFKGLCGISLVVFKDVSLSRLIIRRLTVLCRLEGWHSCQTGALDFQTLTTV